MESRKAAEAKSKELQAPLPIGSFFSVLEMLSGAALYKQRPRRLALDHRQGGLQSRYHLYDL
jgi:hypothetical protein